MAAQIGHTGAQGDRTVKVKNPVPFPLGTSLLQVVSGVVAVSVSAVCTSRRMENHRASPEEQPPASAATSMETTFVVDRSPVDHDSAAPAKAV